ncbi:hypothetical protein [Coleofasciculus sp.]
MSLPSARVAVGAWLPSPYLVTKNYGRDSSAGTPNLLDVSYCLE